MTGHPPVHHLAFALPPAECAEWIALIDAAMGPVTLPGVTGEHPETSARLRAAIESDAAAMEWLRGCGGSGSAEGASAHVSNHWLYVRYDAGDDLAPHTDGSVPMEGLGATSRSVASLLIYLDDGFDGGRTVFPRAAPGGRPYPTYDALVRDEFCADIECAVTPRAGKAVLIRHDALHLGERVSRRKNLF